MGRTRQREIPDQPPGDEPVKEEVVEEDAVMAAFDPTPPEPPEDPLAKAVRESRERYEEDLRESIAAVLYDQAAEEMGIGARYESRGDETRKLFRDKAAAKIDAVIREHTEPQAVAAPAVAQPARADTPSERPQHKINPLGGEARGGGGIDWEPPEQGVILEVRRGNLGHALRLPGDMLNPWADGSARRVIESLKATFLQAQQSPAPGGGVASMPLRPDDDYAVRLTDGTVVDIDGKFVEEMFTGKHDETGLPLANATFIDHSPARTQQPETARGSVGLGNPVVIGTGEHRGEILGVPVAGGAGGQAQPASAGAARMDRWSTDGDPGIGQART